jgi:18S rRNA (guanine1575-N7)-methyltransferase
MCYPHGTVTNELTSVPHILTSTNHRDSPLIVRYAMRAGFSGGLVVDYPNSTRAKKIFLCLVAGGVAAPLPAAKAEDGPATSASFVGAQRDHRGAGKHRGKKHSVPKGSKEWILAKKERRRRQEDKGEVRPDTKFTGRKRRPKF